MTWRKSSKVATAKPANVSQHHIELQPPPPPPHPSLLSSYLFWSNCSPSHLLAAPINHYFSHPFLILKLRTHQVFPLLMQNIFIWWETLIGVTIDYCQHRLWRNVQRTQYFTFKLIKSTSHLDQNQFFDFEKIRIFIHQRVFKLIVQLATNWNLNHFTFWKQNFNWLQLISAEAWL